MICPLCSDSIQSDTVVDSNGKHFAVQYCLNPHCLYIQKVMAFHSNPCILNIAAQLLEDKQFIRGMVARLAEEMTKGYPVR